MKAVNRVIVPFCLLLLAAVVAWSAPMGKAEALSKEQVKKVMPTSVFLDGENAPVQLRNAVGLKLESGKLVLVALVDTSGYSTNYAEKYIGVVLAQGPVMFGMNKIHPGAYGLGVKKGMMGGKESQTFMLYDLGGNQVAAVDAMEDAALRPVTPIQLTSGMTGTRLYLGRYYVSLAAH